MKRSNENLRPDITKDCFIFISRYNMNIISIIPKLNFSNYNQLFRCRFLLSIHYKLYDYIKLELNGNE